MLELDSVDSTNMTKPVQKKFKANIVLILENFEHEENIGSAFRLADAFNCSKIYIISNDSNINFKKIEKTARNCNKTVSYEICSNILDVINKLKNDDFSIISVEVCNDSKPLRSINFCKFNKLALIFGNERFGVSQTSLDNSQICTHIDMFGNNSSMNVSSSIAITLYKICEDILKTKRLPFFYIFNRPIHK